MVGLWIEERGVRDWVRGKRISQRLGSFWGSGNGGVWRRREEKGWGGNGIGWWVISSLKVES
jgi:hypothetical protein